MIVLMDLNEDEEEKKHVKMVVRCSKKEEPKNVSLSIFQAIKLTIFLQRPDYPGGSFLMNDNTKLNTLFKL